MITTTLNRIKEHDPCEGGWKKLLKHLGKKTKADDEPLPFSVIVESNGLDDALWCCRAEPGHDKTWRLFTIWCARQVEHLLTDERSIAAINVAEKYAHGEATEKELEVAWAAASDAARSAAQSAAWTAAQSAAWTAARDAARAAAGAAARAAAGAAAGAAAWTAASDAAWAAAREKQIEKFLEMVN